MMTVFQRMGYNKKPHKPNRNQKSNQTSYRNNTKEVHCDECNGKAIMKLFKIKCMECGVEVAIQ